MTTQEASAKNPIPTTKPRPREALNTLLEDAYHNIKHVSSSLSSAQKTINDLLAADVQPNPLFSNLSTLATVELVADIREALCVPAALLQDYSSRYRALLSMELKAIGREQRFYSQDGDWLLRTRYLLVQDELRNVDTRMLRLYNKVASAGILSAQQLESLTEGMVACGFVWMKEVDGELFDAMLNLID